MQSHETVGRDYTRRELEGYTGDLRQLADIRLATLDDGMERGTRIALVRTGSGFDFTVLLDRAMDIGTATYNGIPLSWQSGTGAAHPAFYEDGTRGWHRTFHGGLLCLCGLTQVGRADPPVDPENGESLVTHGRISNTPAYDIRIEREWNDEQWMLRLSGTVDEVSLGGYRLRLERTMEMTPGSSAVWIRDRVHNMGGQPAPLMVLYHCTFGFPLLSPESVLRIPSTDVMAGNDAGREHLHDWRQFSAPTAGYPQQVFYHSFGGQNETQIVSLDNPALGIGVEMHFSPTALPTLSQWKKLDVGDYVLGLEPGNCLPEERVKAREAERLQMIAPDESIEFRIGFVLKTRM